MNEYRFSDITLGMAEEFSSSITEEMMAHFLSISGDTNPIHIDDEYARSKGFHSRVVWGMCTSALYSRLVGTFLPGKFCLLQGIQITYNHPAYVSNYLTVCGVVSYINQAYQMIEIKAYIESNGVKISKAKIKLGFYE